MYFLFWLHTAPHRTPPQSNCILYVDAQHPTCCIFFWPSMSFHSFAHPFKLFCIVFKWNFARTWDRSQRSCIWQMWKVTCMYLPDKVNWTSTRMPSTSVFFPPSFSGPIHPSQESPEGGRSGTADDAPAENRLQPAQQLQHQRAFPLYPSNDDTRFTCHQHQTHVAFQRQTTWCHLCAGHICSLLFQF